MSECGESGLSRVLVCGSGADRSWQRWATAEELQTLHASGDLPGYMTQAELMVFSCNPHSVASGMAVETPDPEGGESTYVGSDLATVTHDSGCLKPAVEFGECSVCSAAPEPHPEG